MIRTIIGVALGVIGGILFSYALLAEAEPIIVIQNQEPIEQIPETDEHKIVRLIKEVFPDVPVMLEVARCESGYKNIPGETSDDFGPLQINHVHLERMTKLGLNRAIIEDNIKFARILYDTEGLKPWKSSKHCWNKNPQ